MKPDSPQVIDVVARPPQPTPQSDATTLPVPQPEHVANLPKTEVQPPKQELPVLPKVPRENSFAGMVIMTLLVAGSLMALTVFVYFKTNQ